MAWVDSQCLLLAACVTAQAPSRCPPEASVCRQSRAEALRNAVLDVDELVVDVDVVAAASSGMPQNHDEIAVRNAAPVLQADCSPYASQVPSRSSWSEVANNVRFAGPLPQRKPPAASAALCRTQLASSSPFGQQICIPSPEPSQHSLLRRASASGAMVVVRDNNPFDGLAHQQRPHSCPRASQNILAKSAVGYPDTQIPRIRWASRLPVKIELYSNSIANNRCVTNLSARCASLPRQPAWTKSCCLVASTFTGSRYAKHHVYPWTTADPSCARLDLIWRAQSPQARQALP